FLLFLGVVPFMFKSLLLVLLACLFYVVTGVLSGDRIIAWRARDKAWLASTAWAQSQGIRAEQIRYLRPAGALLLGFLVAALITAGAFGMELLASLGKNFPWSSLPVTWQGETWFGLRPWSLYFLLAGSMCLGRLVALVWVRWRRGQVW